MSHVSKQKMDPETARRVVDTLLTSLLSSGAARGKARIRALLTPTERIMLAKRLAIITMLERGDSYYGIMKLLRVSVSTVSRLDKTRVRGDFDPLCRLFSRKLSFLDYLELFASAGLPSIAGPRHESRLDALRTGRKPR